MAKSLYRLVTGIVLICLAAVTPCLAGKGGTKLVGEVTALLNRHDAAVSAQDIKGVMNAYVSGPGSFLMGTGPGEMYRGQEGIEAAYQQFFSKFEKGKMGISYDWVSAGSLGDMAWFAAEGKINGQVKGTKKEIAFNLSGTLQKRKGAWRFIAMHFSRLGVAAEPEEQTGKKP